MRKIKRASSCYWQKRWWQWVLKWARFLRQILDCQVWCRKSQIQQMTWYCCSSSSFCRGGELYMQLQKKHNYSKPSCNVRKNILHYWYSLFTYYIHSIYTLNWPSFKLLVLSEHTVTCLELSFSNIFSRGKLEITDWERVLFYKNLFCPVFRPWVMTSFIDWISTLGISIDTKCNVL